MLDRRWETDAVYVFPEGTGEQIAEARGEHDAHEFVDRHNADIAAYEVELVAKEAQIAKLRAVAQAVCGGRWPPKPSDVPAVRELWQDVKKGEWECEFFGGIADALESLVEDVNDGK